MYRSYTKTQEDAAPAQRMVTGDTLIQRSTTNKLGSSGIACLGQANKNVNIILKQKIILEDENTVESI